MHKGPQQSQTLTKQTPIKSGALTKAGANKVGLRQSRGQQRGLNKAWAQNRNIPKIGAPKTACTSRPKYEAHSQSYKKRQEALGPANAPAKSLGQRLKTVHSSGQKLGTIG